MIEQRDKIHVLPWCKQCHKPLSLKIVKDMAYWYCETVRCSEAGSQVRIERVKLNGAFDKAKAEGYLR